MPGNRPFHLLPAKAAAIPLAALLALNPDDSAEPEGGAGQSPAMPREASAAVFPADDSSPAPSYFAAETAFDCEPGADASDWPGGED